MVFFFLDEKETGQRCKGIFEPVCAAGIQDQTICHAQVQSAPRLVGLALGFHILLLYFY